MSSGIGKHLQEEGQSASFIAERVRRGTRKLEGPHDEFFRPVLASQEVGWDITKEDVREARDALPGSTRSDVTEWAASVFANGGYL